VSKKLAALVPGLLATLVTVGLVGAGAWLRSGGDDGPTVDVDAAVLQWNSGPVGRAQLRDSLTTPEARLMVVRTLLDRATAADPEICGLLTDAGSQAWCASTMHRPHLYEQGKRAVKQRTRPGGGPVDGLLLPTQSVPEGTASGDAPVCPTTEEPRACAAETAMARSKKGDVAGAEAACLHIEPSRWRDECVFTSAEAVFAHNGDAYITSAATMCTMAGRYVSHCLAHVVEAVAARTPSAASARGWDAVVARADAFRATRSDTDPHLGELLVGRYYAEALDQAYARSTTVTGMPFEVLPAEAHPHVRAAAVDRLVRHDPNPRRSLADWVTLVDGALSSKTTSSTSSSMKPDTVKAHTVQDLWSRETPDEQNIPAVFWRGEARRMVSTDPTADQLICLLESLGRMREPPGQSIASVADHSDRAVRLTARRIGRAIRPGGGRR